LLRLHPQTNDFGVAKDGSRKENFTLGMALTARATLFAEGCRGSLSQAVMRRFGLRERTGAQPQTYALGLKEVWEVGGGR
jgi:electron-transferring-flavoprotein dehydrogenase